MWIANDITRQFCIQIVEAFADVVVRVTEPKSCRGSIQNRQVEITHSKLYLM